MLQKIKGYKEDHRRVAICDKCGKEFFNNSSLKYHKAAVHLENVQLCKSDLKKKNNVKRTNKNVKCQFCEKSFVNNTGLKEHILNQHEKDLPFKCEKCTQCFGTKVHEIFFDQIL